MMISIVIILIMTISATKKKVKTEMQRRRNKQSEDNSPDTRANLFGIMKVSRVIHFNSYFFNYLLVILHSFDAHAFAKEKTQVINF